jgi:hypothetical protein
MLLGEKQKVIDILFKSGEVIKNRVIFKSIKGFDNLLYCRRVQRFYFTGVIRKAEP